MQKWKSHKVVEAFRIEGAKWDDDGFRLRGRLETVVVDPEHADRMINQASGLVIGGYYVRYEDGYESWSPAEAFEAGYTRVEEPRPAEEASVGSFWSEWSKKKRKPCSTPRSGRAAWLGAMSDKRYTDEEAQYLWYRYTREPANCRAEYEVKLLRRFSLAGGSASWRLSC